jgi:hypothetical protein
MIISKALKKTTDHITKRSERGFREHEMIAHVFLFLESIFHRRMFVVQAASGEFPRDRKMNT